MDSWVKLYLGAHHGGMVMPSVAAVSRPHLPGRSSARLAGERLNEAPGIAPGRFVSCIDRGGYSSSSAIPTGTSCGGAGSSTRGGGAS